MSQHLTLTTAAERLHGALSDYIEATYHISDPHLIGERRRLLEADGVVHQPPYIESTPRYLTGEPFEHLGLPDPAARILRLASEGSRPLVVNPPWLHQAESLKTVLSDRSSLIVTTGTGSGKTECFLLPLLGLLALEAETSPSSFATPAVRALILYPMNALVNDQLGRLRALFGDERISDHFTEFAGRPARFARYTSRTPYPGVRTKERDQSRLKPIADYYVKQQMMADGDDGSRADQDQAERLVRLLRERGKWPAKPDLRRWFGEKGTHWQSPTGEFKRAVTLPEDPELLTRHEVLNNPPDVLVTNYSMLEYMMMRPLEKPIFDATRSWLAENPEQKFLLVVDEAHLYRGAAGSEVALLLRRLTDRLGIGQDRLQVICTSASFDSSERAAEFAAALSGKDRSDFHSVSGNLALKSDARRGSAEEAIELAAIDLDLFYETDGLEDKLEVVRSFVESRGGGSHTDVRVALYEALEAFGPMSLLINETMREAQAVDDLGALLFPSAESQVAERAASNLVALGSFCRPADSLDGPGLLPARVHAFFRGLPGLWVCPDGECTETDNSQTNRDTGRLFGQPRNRCDCGARVFEFFTCRHCGSAYARAYTYAPEDPTYLWSEPGMGFETAAGFVDAAEPVDMLLAQPDTVEGVEPADLDLVTGRLNPRRLGPRVRRVYLRRVSEESTDRTFTPCGICGKRSGYGRSSVQDHVTKGDEPFRAVITEQIRVQPQLQPPTHFAPLGGRKVLVFSDSRQTAARLAPNLQKYTMRDAVRPLILHGFGSLLNNEIVRPFVTLEDSYLAVLLAAASLGVRLRPQIRDAETFDQAMSKIRDYLGSEDRSDQSMMQLLIDIRTERPPEALLDAIHYVINDRYWSLENLGLASLIEAPGAQGFESDLPSLGDGFETDEEKRALARLWLSEWNGQWTSNMPPDWLDTRVVTHKGSFAGLNRYLVSRGVGSDFRREWLPSLLEIFGSPRGPKWVLLGQNLRLDTGGSWAYCTVCRTTQRPFPGSTVCVACNRNTAGIIDPTTDEAFSARKSYYRSDAVAAIEQHVPPLALVAAEHTAQLNESQPSGMFSAAEEHELLFQDVDLGIGKPAIDILSCTTTMEVGIDIGALAGVALRNMPPARANYQQRAGRAGRRGHAVATVTAYAGADSHDEHCFSEPADVIRGPVTDPVLRLDNWQIARRHVTAFLLQEYLGQRFTGGQEGTQHNDASGYGSQLFEVLGSVDGFLDQRSVLNRWDFAGWLSANEDDLVDQLASWLPDDVIRDSDPDHLRDAVSNTVSIVDTAIDYDPAAVRNSTPTPTDAVGAEDLTEPASELPPETGESSRGDDSRTHRLLDRLLDRGVLPRYAFPTDVAAFHVFDVGESTQYRKVFRYTPSQGLPIALSQYAPGKTVWIDGKEWTSGAIYSPASDERFAAWTNRRLYMECRVCGYARTTSLSDSHRGEVQSCPACGSSDQLGPAQTWFRPPGFAHPVDQAENTSPDDEPMPSYATRAKLVAPAEGGADSWTTISPRVRTHFMRSRLLVTNTGPRNEGYSYCTKCGRVEQAVRIHSQLSGAHLKPFPDDRAPDCDGGGTARNMVLGTDFVSDVLLVSLSVDDPLTLRPEYLASRVALRTIAEAFVRVANIELGLEPNELQAEFRPALTPSGKLGREAEVYLYDILPGGAGFAAQVGEMHDDLLTRTLGLLEGCPDGCDASCYRCLRNYRNKLDHALLDRHIGAGLLRYLVGGDAPTIDEGRQRQSIDALYEDLLRQDLPEVSIQRDVDLTAAGLDGVRAPILVNRSGAADVVVCLQSPLSPDEPLDSALLSLRDFSLTHVLHPVDELIVRQNLPAASQGIIDKLGGVN